MLNLKDVCLLTSYFVREQRGRRPFFDCESKIKKVATVIIFTTYEITFGIEFVTVSDMISKSNELNHQNVYKNRSSKVLYV